MSRTLKLLKPALLSGAALAGATTAAAMGGAILGTVAIGTLAWRALKPKPLPAGSVVLVTGGSRGLGFAIASRFARDRVRLVLAARDREELERAQASLLAQNAHLSPEDFYLVAADLSQREECERMVTEAFTRFGRIDVLVNNAGIIQIGPIEVQTPENFERAMRLNFFGALHTTLAALPHLRTQTALAGCTRARIVNISSVGGKIPVPHMLPYTAAKFALTGFSEGLHAELRSKNIRVTTVCPGLMRTGGEAHAEFLGDVEAEKRWFNFGAKTPGVAVTAEHAAHRIYSATVSGRAEITISPQAFLAARIHGLCPESTQCLGALANRYVLPAAPNS